MALDHHVDLRRGCSWSAPPVFGTSTVEGRLRCASRCSMHALRDGERELAAGRAAPRPARERHERVERVVDRLAPCCPA